MELKELAEKYLGADIYSNELDKAKGAAEHKLNFIISRDWDAGGNRKEPGYLAQFIAEAVKEIRSSRFSYGLMAVMEAKEKPATLAASNSLDRLYCIRQYLELQ